VSEHRIPLPEYTLLSEPQTYVIVGVANRLQMIMFLLLVVVVVMVMVVMMMMMIITR
jgi:hypothetical protein